MIKCITVEFDDGVVAMFKDGKWHANQPLYNRYLFILAGLWKAARVELSNEKKSRELEEVPKVRFNEQG